MKDGKNLAAAVFDKADMMEHMQVFHPEYGPWLQYWNGFMDSLNALSQTQLPVFVIP
jgi:hypothetical protein